MSLSRKLDLLKFIFFPSKKNKKFWYVVWLNNRKEFSIEKSINNRNYWAGRFIFK